MFKMSLFWQFLCFGDPFIKYYPTILYIKKVTSLFYFILLISMGLWPVWNKIEKGCELIQSQVKCNELKFMVRGGLEPGTPSTTLTKY